MPCQVSPANSAVTATAAEQGMNHVICLLTALPWSAAQGSASQCSGSMYHPFLAHLKLFSKKAVAHCQLHCINASHFWQSLGQCGAQIRLQSMWLGVIEAPHLY